MMLLVQQKVLEICRNLRHFWWFMETREPKFWNSVVLGNLECMLKYKWRGVKE